MTKKTTVIFYNILNCKCRDKEILNINSIICFRLHPTFFFADVEIAEGAGGEIVSSHARVDEVDRVWGETREGARFETERFSV